MPFKALYNFNFLYFPSVCLKFNIPEFRHPDMKMFDQSDTEVDGEVFEIVKESPGTFHVKLSNEELGKVLKGWDGSNNCSI